MLSIQGSAAGWSVGMMEGEPTIDNVALLDLREHVGPHAGVARAVLANVLGFELDDLGEAAAWVEVGRGRRLLLL